MGWATIDDARDLAAHEKVDAEAFGKWIQPLLDAAQPGWNQYDVS